MGVGNMSYHSNALVGEGNHFKRQLSAAGVNVPLYLKHNCGPCQDQTNDSIPEHLYSVSREVQLAKIISEATTSRILSSQYGQW